MSLNIRRSSIRVLLLKLGLLGDVVACDDKPLGIIDSTSLATQIGRLVDELCDTVELDDLLDVLLVHKSFLGDLELSIAVHSPRPLASFLAALCKATA